MKRFAAIVATAGLPLAAQAQEEQLEDGVYVRIGAGASFVADWEQDYVYNPDRVFVTAPPTGQTVSNGEGFVAAAAIGFDYADGIRTELEYRYATSGIDGVVVNDIAGPVTPTVENEDINAHFIMSNFYFDFYNDSRFTPFIGGGVGGAFVENENGDRDAALAWQARGGVSVDFSNGFFVDLEYAYLRTNKLVYGPEDDDFTPDGPDFRIDGERYQSSSVMISLRKHF